MKNMKELKINHAAVWVGVVLLTAFGYIWYEPLFGDQWMSLVGLERATIEADPPGAGIWISNLIATVIPLYALAWLFVRLNVRSALEGAGIGLLIGFSFVFLSRMTSDMFAQNPYGLSWIVGGFSTISIVIGGALLGAWRKYK